jgi:hypothetical protein
MALSLSSFNYSLTDHIIRLTPRVLFMFDTQCSHFDHIFICEQKARLLKCSLLNALWLTFADGENVQHFNELFEVCTI